MAFGEAWHNNHHAFPGSARHGLGRWQLDPSAGLICALERCTSAGVGITTDGEPHARAAKAGLVGTHGLETATPALVVAIAGPDRPPRNVFSEEL